MRIDRSIERVPALLATGVTEQGHRTMLGLQAGDKESSSNWRQLFKNFKSLDISGVTLASWMGSEVQVGKRARFRGQGPRELLTGLSHISEFPQRGVNLSAHNQCH